jgi:REP element-mobilizing transposase RayT
MYKEVKQDIKEILKKLCEYKKVQIVEGANRLLGIKR